MVAVNSFMLAISAQEESLPVNPETNEKFDRRLPACFDAASDATKMLNATDPL